jgi:outer membrane protein
MSEPRRYGIDLTMEKILVFLLMLLSTVAVAHAGSAGGPARAEMTLDQAVGYALEHSPDLQSAKAETARREGVATTTRAGLLPQVDVLGDISHTRYDHAYPPATSPEVIRFDDTIYTAGAELKALVWDFGQTANELAAARERILSSQLLQDRRKQEVIYNVASLYLKALTYDDLIDAAHSTRKSLQALLDQTKELAEAGRAVPADVLKVSTRLAQVESDLATLDAGRRTSVSRLAAAMGFDGEPPRLAYAPPGGAGSAPRGKEDDLIREALARRPDLGSQKHEAKAASDQETAARRSRWPRAELHAGVYEYGAPDPVSSLGSQGPKPGEATDDWAVGLRITFPLFDAGKRSGQVRSAAAQAELARAAERKLRLDIEDEVRSALAELESAEKRVQATRQSVAQAEEVLRNERLKYEAGRSVINFVLDAEAALLTNQSLLRQARRAVTIDRLVLDLSLGRINAAPAISPRKDMTHEP